MICAIHQPNFFPWLGYFHKLTQADVFVFLDNVQYPKTNSGTWVNRVKFLIGGSPQWFTCPIRRESGAQQIRNIQIHDDSWKIKLRKTLSFHYGKANFFPKIMPLVETILNNNETHLAAFNIHAISELVRFMEIDTRLINQSSLHDIQPKASGSCLLASICTQVGANTYLAGDGASSYEDTSQYDKCTISLTHTAFTPKPYPQGKTKEFIPGLSILDALMHLGPEETKAMLQGKRKSFTP